MKFLVVIAVTLTATQAFPNLGITPAEIVEQGKAPFVVSLQQCLNGVCVSDCTGVVVNEKYVLSSAWCATEPRRVVIGAVDLPDDGGEDVTRMAVWNIRHPKYEIGKPQNDIALLLLNAPIELGDKAKALPLPKQGQEPTDDKVEVYGYSSMWLKNGPLYVARNQTVVSSQDCNIKSRTDKNYYCLTPVQASEGDNGGPVVQNGVLIGITSLVHADFKQDQPRQLSFLPVNQYADWIQSVIKQ